MCGVVWGFRWLWPLQLVPGWVVVSLVIWAGLELIVLLRHPIEAMAPNSGEEQLSIIRHEVGALPQSCTK